MNIYIHIIYIYILYIIYIYDITIIKIYQPILSQLCKKNNAAALPDGR